LVTVDNAASTASFRDRESSARRISAGRSRAEREGVEQGDTLLRRSGDRRGGRDVGRCCRATKLRCGVQTGIADYCDVFAEKSDID
jgi:hypothetical protein